MEEVLVSVKGEAAVCILVILIEACLGSFGIVAAGPPVVLGAALQEKINGGDKDVCYFYWGWCNS